MMKRILMMLVCCIAAIGAADDPRPKEYYRYYGDRVKLLPLADKGIAGKDVKWRWPQLVKDGLELPFRLITGLKNA